MDIIIILTVAVLGIKVYYLNRLLPVRSGMDMLYANQVFVKWNSLQKYLVLDSSLLLFYILLGFGYFSPVLLFIALIDSISSRKLFVFADEEINSYDEYVNKVRDKIAVSDSVGNKENSPAFNRLVKQSNFLWLYKSDFLLLIVVLMELKTSTPLF